MREFISSEITFNIIDQTPVIFGRVKEGILEILDERLGTFRTEMAAMVGARTMTFREFRACGALDYHGDRDPSLVAGGWRISPMPFAPTDVPRGTSFTLLPIS